VLSAVEAVFLKRALLASAAVWAVPGFAFDASAALGRRSFCSSALRRG
jgi:hypothetical protein